jgi:hypothetical protein
VKEGCKYLNPSNGAREQLVTNFRSKQRSVGLNPLMTCIMSKNVRTILIFIFAVGKQKIVISSNLTEMPERQTDQIIYIA